MNVYLVEMDNGESYEDYYSWIDTVYTTYRAASMDLIERGYEVYPERSFSSGEWDLGFEWKELDDDIMRYSGAKIIEKELWE